MQWCCHYPPSRVLIATSTARRGEASTISNGRREASTISDGRREASNAERMQLGIPSRKLMEHTWTNPQVLNVLLSIYQNVFTLVKGYALHNGLDDDWVTKTLVNGSINQSGSMDKTFETLQKNLTEGGGGNLRTWLSSMSMFLNFGACSVLWWVFIGTYRKDKRVFDVVHAANMSIDAIYRRIAEMEDLVGYPMSYIVETCSPNPMDVKRCYIYKDEGRSNELLNACNLSVLRK